MKRLLWFIAPIIFICIAIIFINWDWDVLKVFSEMKAIDRLGCLMLFSFLQGLIQTCPMLFDPRKKQ